jgi:hypothetical protein
MLKKKQRLRRLSRFLQLGQLLLLPPSLPFLLHDQDLPSLPLFLLLHLLLFLLQTWLIHLLHLPHLNCMSSDKTWTSAVWQLDLFETSKEKVDEVHFKVRCKACGWEILLDGTTAVANHAKKHSQNVKVQNWLLRKAQDASERKQIAASSEAEFIAVCCRFLLVTFHYLLPALSLRKNMASTTTFDLLLKPMRGRRRWEKESRSGTGAPNSMRSSAGLCTTSFFLMAILFQPLRARG